MKFMVFLLSMLSIAFASYGQCEVKVYTSQGEPVYQAQFEDLYKSVGQNNDGDYGYGFQTIKVSVTATGRNKQLSLFVGVVTHGAYPAMAPRTLRIVFTSGRIFEKTASSHDSSKGIDIYEFPLLDSEQLYFSSPIQQVSVSDNRTGNIISGKSAYANVISEQIQCVLSK